MVTTIKISPSPPLQPFINYYLFREFNTQGYDLKRPWIATQEVYLTFFLKDRPLHLMNKESGYYVTGSNSMVIQGLATHFNGVMTFNGCYSIINICFKPNGFYKIFNTPPDVLTNKISDISDFFSVAAKSLYEKLLNAKNVNEMKALINYFLLQFLTKQKQHYLNDVITTISNILFDRAGQINIERLAYQANMSLRNFERRFTEQIGISPKLFSRIIRFNHALELKMEKPEENWTSVVYECGYFDQMHFIKDFKEFAGLNPNMFLRETPLPEEKIILL